MTLVQKFDAVLDALYDISGQRPTFGRILALLRKRKHNIHWGEVWDILNKMRRDGVIREPIIQNNIKGVDKEIYLITFEGKLMKERNGLKGKFWREGFTKWRVGILEALTFLVALTTLLYTTCSANQKCCDTNSQTIQQDTLRTDSMTQLKQKTEQDTFPDKQVLSRQSKIDTNIKKNVSADTTNHR